MSYFKEVCRCVNCKKVYPDGIPTLCHKCGTKLGKKSVFGKLIFGEDRVEFNENCEKVIAKRTFFGWKVKEDATNADFAD